MAKPEKLFAQIKVYFTDGTVRTYVVEAQCKEELHARVREHHHAIITKGYRSMNGHKLTSYPVHKIEKVTTESEHLNSNYPDKVQGT